MRGWSMVTRRLFTATLGLLIFLAPAFAADKKNDAPAEKSEAPAIDTQDSIDRHTVALYTYYIENGKPHPSKVFSGLLLKNGNILTSSWALEQGHVNQFTKFTGKSGDLIMAVIHKGKSGGMVVACKKLEVAAGSPLAVLEVNEKQRDLVIKMTGDQPEIIKSPPAVKEKIKQPKTPSPSSKNKKAPTPTYVALDADVTGVVGPFGLMPKELSPKAVPQPLEMSIRLGSLGSVTEGQYEGAVVLAAVPPQLVGAGIWNSADDKFLGILVRDDLSWYMLGVSSIAKLLAPPPVQKPDVADAAKPADMPKEDPKPEPVVEVKAKKIADWLAEMKLASTLNPKMIDETGDPKADEITAMLAAGQGKEALPKIEEYLQGADQKLKERLMYRKTVAMTFAGDWEKAKEMIDNFDKSLGDRYQDPVMAARIRLIHWVLTKAPSGTYEGKKISEPEGLSAACQGWLEHIMGQSEEGLEAANNMPVEDHDTWKRKDAKYEQALTRLNAYKLAWPGYFDEIEGKILKARTDAAAKAPKS